MSDKGKSLSTSASIPALGGFTYAHVCSNQLVFIPEEIATQILASLPVRSLIRFSSVSKSWESTIKTPRFIDTHRAVTRKSNEREDTHLFLVHRVHNDFVDGLDEFKPENSSSLYYDNTDAITDCCRLRFPDDDDFTYRRAFRVVGTLNGLVLMADDDELEENGRLFVLWNPRIRKYLTLSDPFPDPYYYCNAVVGLGYYVKKDEKGEIVEEDYKVVRIATRCRLGKPRPYDQLCKCEVYSVAKGSWSRVSPPLQCVVYDYSPAQVFVNGALHWMAYIRNFIDGDEREWFDHFILTFNVAAESFGWIQLPNGFKVEETPNCRLSVSGDGTSIGLFVTIEASSRSLLDYWTMEEYGNETSWIKLMVLGPHDQITNLDRELCFRRNGQVLLLLKDGRILSFDMFSREVTHIWMSGRDLGSVHCYEESLVFLERKDPVSY